MDTNKSIRGMSNSEIIRVLGKRYKTYRLTCGLTQQEAADRAGVGLVTLRNFENGKSYNITMSNFLGLLRTVGVLDQIQEVLPEMPISPFLLEKIEKRKPKRVRHGKKTDTK